MIGNLSACFSIVVMTLTLAIPLSAAGDGHGYGTVLLPAKRVVLSARVDSIVKKHRFKEGEKFDKGDILVELDSDLYKQLLKRAEAEYAYYKKEAARNKGLLEDDAVGESDYAKSVLMRESSAANLAIAKMNFERCVIRAPFAGRVAKLITEAFEFVRTSQPLLEIIDDRTLLAVVHLPAELRGKVKIGSEAIVTLDGTGKSLRGVVREVSAEIDPASRSFSAKIAVDNKDSKLTAGMSGIVTFPDVPNGKPNPAEQYPKGQK